MNVKWLAVAAAALVTGGPVHAYDVSESLSIGGTLGGAYQCLSVSGDSDSDDACRGAVPFQAEVGFRPSETNELFFKLGFAAGNGLNPVSPFLLAPWAADLEDDVKDINGRGRDYLLAAWYKHTFALANESSLGASIGILDSTDYLDGNAYANDEYTQFMNEAFVNSGSYGLPSYDTGAALEWESGNWSARAIGMSVGENDDGNGFTFWGVEAAYRAETALGEGNYRVTLAGASEEFLDPEGEQKEDRLAWGISFDQAFGEVVGGFLRLGWQTDDAAVTHKALYSGGLNLQGVGWGREADNVGVGYAYLDGGNLDVSSTQVAELYYRFGVNEYLGITADVQYMSDEYEEDSDVEGWVLGVRAVAAF
jgi:porin